jgi:hypothetical protein
MKANICLSILCALIIGSFAFANVPPPIAPEKLIIKLRENYSEYVFYLCKYQGDFDLETNSDGYRKIIMEENTFEVLPIQLTKEKPLILKREDYSSLSNAHLVAVRRDINEQIQSTLKEKLMNIVSSQKDDDGIYESLISVTYRNCGNNTPCDTNYPDAVVEVENLSEKGLQFKGFDKGLRLNSLKKAETKEKSKNCFGTILFAMGMTFSGIWFLRRKRRK